MLLVLDRRPDDRQVGLEIEFEHAQRLAHVSRRRRDRHQRQDHVAFANVVFDPLLVDRDVALEKPHARMRRHLAEAARRHVHAVDLPLGRIENAARQVVPDEAVDAKDEHFLHGLVRWD